ncbi:MAG: polysaccharide deacetylase family protein [Gammaproteobacteria bacterium]|nr:polysaccharide deacetylase family protein [Gammaproteobacteria bacterium]
MRSPRCAVSIHDVMPETLSRCEKLFAQCQRCDITRVTLLVVPGRTWIPDDIERLKNLLSRGAVLAGHGWRHRIDTSDLRGFAPCLHSLLMSRNVAEHLVLDENGIDALIRRCHAWFVEHDLPEPALYVPPAWAMGKIARGRLDELPFRFYEYFSGVYDSDRRCFVRSPVVGFEADSFWRAGVVGGWNSLSRRLAGLSGQWRISLHPDDLSLALHGQLQDFLRDVENPVTYTDLMPSRPLSSGADEFHL